ncbi:putative D13 [Neospora caninum Liverpool]|uniref:Putative D13 n=1 Tax=Neospora caninum (strain Liverpool) TaxID=572307 RepID=F0VJL6_NEOCL|nr:putative D13 [Neospora caninum Liverpool]CBZ53927.1 putative D13 [Neospora caninum Liverpool]|eukprot:XP_003883959.1 putative D13 [Neospora caninum Liverpool]
MACGSLLSEEDLCRFRTKKCRRLVSGACEFGITRCQYSHNQYWSRRCPIYLSDRSFIRYIHVLCPHVTTKQADPTERPTHGGGCGRPRCARRPAGSGAVGQQNQHIKGNGRRRGGEEILYHPLFYKMIICEKYREDVCDTYYCPYIHGLAEARQPKQYKLPFTTGIDIPPLPCVTIVAKIEKKKAPLSTLTLGDSPTAAAGPNEALTRESAGSMLRQAVAAAQRQHHQLQQRGFQFCRSLKNAGDGGMPGESRLSGEQLAHSTSSVIEQASQSMVRAYPHCTGEAGASVNDDGFACKALFDALRTLEGDNTTCTLSMTGGGRRTRARESGLEAVAARLTASRHRSFSGSRWANIRPGLASQLDNTDVGGRDRQVEELTPPKAAPPVMLGGIAPETAAALASRMSPVQLLTAAFELCGHDSRNDTIGFSHDAFDGAQNASTDLPDVGPSGKLAELRCSEADRRTDKQLECGMEEASEVPVGQGGADNEQMVSAQRQLQFGPQSSSCSGKAVDRLPTLPVTSVTPSQDQLVSEGECPQASQHVPQSAAASRSADEEGGMAGGMPFASLESSTASSPLSSPSSPSQDFQSGDLVAFTTQSDTSRDQPCCMSATTRSPSESGAEPDLSSPDRSSYHSVSSTGGGHTGNGAATAEVGAGTSEGGATESGAVVGFIKEHVVEEETTNEGERGGSQEEEIRETMVVGKARSNEWTRPPRSCMSQPSELYAACGAEADAEQDNEMPVQGERTERLEGDGLRSEVCPQRSDENIGGGLALQGATHRTPNDLIDILEQVVKTLWENVWKHTPKQWTRIQCASREVGLPPNAN